MTLNEFAEYLRTSGKKVFVGTINRKLAQCLAIYPGTGIPPVRGFGGVAPSYDTLPVRLLIHWGEDTDVCQGIANELYTQLFTKYTGEIVGGKRVVLFQLLDSAPVDLLRDENNICEMVIRLNIIYER